MSLNFDIIFEAAFLIFYFSSYARLCGFLAGQMSFVNPLTHHDTVHVKMELSTFELLTQSA